MLSLLLWLILLVRVTQPMLPESAFSIYNLIPAGRMITYTLTHDYDQVTGTEAVDTAENPYRFPAPGESLPSENGEETPSEVGDGAVSAVTWGENMGHRICILFLAVFLFGMVLMGCIQGMLYERAIHRVYRNSSLCRDPRILQIYTETAAGLRIMDKKAPPCVWEAPPCWPALYVPV